MSKNQLFFLIALLVLFYSCTKPRPIEQAHWLIGEWEHIEGEEHALEIWNEKDDSTLSGRAYSIIISDTVWSERIAIEERSGDLFYVPTVSDQNNGRPVTFILTSSSEGKLVFENPQHDFPQRITYRRLGMDSLVAEISSLDDPSKKQTFPMSRVKE